MRKEHDLISTFEEIKSKSSTWPADVCILEKVTINGSTFFVDGHFVKQKHTKREIEVGYLLSVYLGKRVNILPVVE